MSFKIIGTGSYLPPKILTNEDLTQMVDTTDEWITTRTGIKERHICQEETTHDMACCAGRRALEAAGVAPEGLGLVLCATLTADARCPSLAASLLAPLQAEQAAAFDINAACSGFLFALRIAADWIAREGKPILLIGADRLSPLVDWEDRRTCVLFGDGAGACVLAPDPKGQAFIQVKTQADTLGVLSVGLKEASIQMDGQEVYKFATRACAQRLTEVIEAAGILKDDVTHIVPHQANARIVAAAADRLRIPRERFYINIGQVGNTSAASIPIALDEYIRGGNVTEGDWLAMVAFGGGLTSGAALLRW